MVLQLAVRAGTQVWSQADALEAYLYVVRCIKYAFKNALEANCSYAVTLQVYRFVHTMMLH